MSGEVPLPKGWAWSTLGEVATWGSGGTPKSGHASYYNGDIPWAIIGDLNDGIVSATANTITTEGLANSSAKLVSNDAVLIAMYGSIGKLGLPTSTIATNQAIAFAVPHVEVLDRKYLFWYLRHSRQDLIRAGKGGTQQNISQTVLKAWPIAIPPLAEQHRIVEALEDHLSRLDVAEAGLNAVAARLAGLSQRTISNSVQTAGAELRPLRYFLRDKPRNGRSVPTAEVGFPVLRLTALRGDTVDMLEHKIGDWDRRQAAPYLVRENDVLLSRGNGSIHLVGRAALVRKPPPEIAFPDTMIRIPLNLDLVDADFFVQVWNSREVRRQVETLARTTAGIHKINQSILQSINFPDIPIDVQRCIAAEISTSDIQNRYVQTAVLQGLRRSAALRRHLLSAAFSGTLVDQDPTDEPASALLERITAERASHTPASRRRTPAKADAKV